MKPWQEIERLEFNKKIRTKLENGFTPDIRAQKFNPYFIKQFWRDPYFTNCFLGELVNRLKKYIEKYVGKGTSILDVGCGAGYISLELARNGFHVTGIDVADDAISAAKETLNSAERTSEFGSLSYEARAFSATDARFDAVLFCASLHHFPETEVAVEQAFNILKPNGVLVCYEPSRETWTEADVAPIAALRAAFAISGNWYDSSISSAAKDVDSFSKLVESTMSELLECKDELTPDGQSENHDIGAGVKIFDAIQKLGELLETAPAFAYLHNGLGGLRGPDEVTHRLADLIVTFERYAIEKGIIRANSEFFVARKREN